MKRLRQNVSVLVALGGAAMIAGEIGWLQHVRAEAERAVEALEQTMMERDRLARHSPPPTVETELAIAAEWEATRRNWEKLCDEWREKGAIPSRPTDAFFALAGLVEQARARADAARVAMRPDERFGFAAFAHEGPPPELLGEVHRQQALVERLLETLFAARPLALVGVRRAMPPEARADGPAATADFFAPDPAISVRHAGLIETDSVRLEFTGQTETLRTLLTGLAALHPPVVVRSIDVEPLPSAQGARGGEPGGLRPWVRSGNSKFSVTVESIRLAAVPGDPVP